MTNFDWNKYNEFKKTASIESTNDPYNIYGLKKEAGIVRWAHKTLGTAAGKKFALEDKARKALKYRVDEINNRKMERDIYNKELNKLVSDKDTRKQFMTEYDQSHGPASFSAKDSDALSTAGTMAGIGLLGSWLMN